MGAILIDGRIRKSIISGTWYPGSKEELRATIGNFFKNISPLNLDGDVLSLISPHAGYIYSGQVAAYAYNAIRKKEYDAVIIIGPSHRMIFPGASIYDEGGYETPLGIVPINISLARKVVLEGERICSNPELHDQEHSIEIQLPFLQYVLGSLSLVPILMGDQDYETCRNVADAIIHASDGLSILVVASSDLSHYHPYTEAIRMDSVVLERIEKNDPEGLLKDLQKHKAEACGGGPVAVAMMVAKGLGGDRSKILKYSNSGDITGDRSGVVGYGAAVLYRKV
jgi:hypothetical protein